jgi:hypothetical protein
MIEPTKLNKGRAKDKFVRPFLEISEFDEGFLKRRRKSINHILRFVFSVSLPQRHHGIQLVGNCSIIILIES